MSRLSTARGGYGYLGSTHAFSSLQNGRVFRHTYMNGSPLGGGSEITTTVGSAFFITPFAFDPVDDRIMFYPSYNILWRNANTSSSPPAPWESVDGIGLPEQHLISWLSVSTEPAHILYIGTWSPIEPSRLLRLANADTTSSGAVDVSAPGVPVSAWTSSIAVNPSDADELIVAYSNYNIDGLYHSLDGGTSWESIEGNLLGDVSVPGPSIRSATILPVASGTVYLVGTSTGVYSTDDLNGSATIWEKEGAEEIGNAIVSQISSRPSDGRVLVATHGRGAFFGDRNANPVAVEDLADLPSHILFDVAAYPNPFENEVRVAFSLGRPAGVSVELFDMLGRRIGAASASGQYAVGRQTVLLSGSGLASGRYGYRVEVTSGELAEASASGLVVKR